MDWLLTSSSLVFGLTLLGGLVPLFLGRTERWRHLLVSLAAGIFLGAVFLHLLPEVAVAASHDGHDGHGSEGLWLSLMAGVVVLFLIEYLFLRGTAEGEGHAHDHHEDEDPLCHEDHIPGADRHRMVGFAALVGLSLHSVADGLGLSAGLDFEELRPALTMAVLSHKAIGGFTLAVALLLGNLARRRFLAYLVGFALITPVAALSRAVLLPGIDESGLDMLTAFAAGTFMYVALCDLLPEVFHERRDGAWKVVLMLSGVAISHSLHLP